MVALAGPQPVSVLLSLASAVQDSLRKLRTEIVAKPGEYPVPTVRSGFLPVAGALDGEEGVPCVLIHVELVCLAEALENFIRLLDLFLGRAGVLGAE